MLTCPMNSWHRPSFPHTDLTTRTSKPCLFIQFRTLFALQHARKFHIPLLFSLFRTLSKNTGEWGLPLPVKRPPAATEAWKRARASELSPRRTTINCRLSTSGPQARKSCTMNRCASHVCNSCRMNTYTNAALKTLWNQPESCVKKHGIRV